MCVRACVLSYPTLPISSCPSLFIPPFSSVSGLSCPVFWTSLSVRPCPCCFNLSRWLPCCGHSNTLGLDPPKRKGEEKEDHNKTNSRSSSNTTQAFSIHDTGLGIGLFDWALNVRLENYSQSIFNLGQPPVHFILR